jgi:hypothetical protein
MRYENMSSIVNGTEKSKNLQCLIDLAKGIVKVDVT